MKRRIHFRLVAVLATTLLVTGFASAADKQRVSKIGMALVLIPAGTFDMGSPESDPRSDQSEYPQHRVQITKPFYIGKYEVTRREFGEFVRETNYVTEDEKEGAAGSGYNPLGAMLRNDSFNWKNTGFRQTDRHPVVNVSWDDACAFCEWLSKKEGSQFRLPTQAEWEYACRAGTKSPWHFGDNPSDLKRYANAADLSRRLKFLNENVENWSDGFPFTAPVGSFAPNKFGVHDMYGNVYEWCADWEDDWETAPYYRKSPQHDPRGPEKAVEGAEGHIMRGGSWGTGVVCCRSAYRTSAGAEATSCEIGFRVVNLLK